MKTKLIALTALGMLLLSSCKKEEVSEPLETVVTHRYTYNDKTYDVELTFDKDFHLIKLGGEYKEYHALFSEKKNYPQAYLVEKIDERSTLIEVRVFDDVKAMNTYQGVQPPLVENMEKCGCTDWSNPGQGTANYTFYRDINYSNEFTSLVQWMVSYFQDEHMNTENDQISSISMWGTAGESLDMFEHCCFSGVTTRITSSVPNLHLLTFRWVSVPVVDANGNTYLILVQDGNWGDKISSLKGWSY